MKFLIDECRSPTLAAMARECGFHESTHVTWVGLRSRQDWALVRRAVEDGYVLVTPNPVRPPTSRIRHKSDVHPHQGSVLIAGDRYATLPTMNTPTGKRTARLSLTLNKRNAEAPEPGGKP